jgi:hypothetical protein
MTDLARLQASLARLSAPPERVVGQERWLVGAGPKDLALAMRQETEETQLPRTLCFRNDRDERLVLQVRAGKIAKLVSAPQYSDYDVDSAQLNLDEAGTAQTDIMRKVIRDFVRDVAAISVMSDLRAPDISPALIGICPRDCFPSASAFDQEVASGSPPALEDALARVLGLVTAWIRVQGGMLCNSQGDPACILRLEELARAELEGRAAAADSEPSTATEDICVIISAAGIGAEAILSASLGDSLVFMSFPASKVCEIAGLWCELVSDLDASQY